MEVDERLKQIVLDWRAENGPVGMLLIYAERNLGHLSDEEKVKISAYNAELSKPFEGRKLQIKKALPE